MNRIVGFHIWHTKGFDNSLSNKYFFQRREETSNRKLKKYGKEAPKRIKVGKKIYDKKKQRKKLRLLSPFYYIKYEALRNLCIETLNL